MQHILRGFVRLSAGVQISAVVKIALVCLATGCADRPSTIDVRGDQPHREATLRVAATNAADLPLLRHLAATWANRHHATVTVSDRLGDETADMWLISPAELPGLAEGNRLSEVPADVLKTANAYRWDDIFTVNSSRMCAWRDQTWALPVVGEGIVFAYRTDHFSAKAGQGRPVPTHWAELVRQAKASPRTVFSAWPASPEAREAIFFTLAASLDREAITRLSSKDLVRDEFFSFHFDPATGASRMAGPAFVEAAGIMAELTPMAVRGADAVDGFNNHGAVCGFLTLEDLARLDADVAGKVGILPVLGVTHTYNAKGERVPVSGGNVNRVPYLGWGGRVGVVSAKCQHPEAAWGFWADAGMPDQQSFDLIAATKWGAGPFRPSHLDARARPRWLGYQLSPSETDRLANALRDNLGIGSQNFRTRLRTPNERELRVAFQRRLEVVLAGRETPEQAMRATDQEWMAIIQGIPPDQWREWVRKSLGL